MGNKKNIFIGLSMLLLVLLLGLSTRTYAKELDLNELKNFVLNAFLYRNGENADTTNVKNFLNTTETNLQNIIDTLNQNEGHYILTNPDNRYVFCFYYTGNQTNMSLYAPYDRTSYNTFNIDTSYLTGKRVAIDFKNFSIGSWSTQSSVTYNNNTNTPFFYTDTNIYTGSSIANSNVVYGYGTEIPNNLFYGDYTPEQQNVIRFEPYPTKISDVYVAQNYNLTAYGCSKNNTYVSMRFGDLIQPPSYLIEEIDVTMSYYNRGQSKWIEKYLLIETGEDLVPSNYKSSIANFKWENYEDYTITFSAFINNEYVHDDCLYTFSFIGKDTSGTPFYIEQTFYIIGSNTIITDGTLDVSFLVTGDYSNDYANDLNELASKIDDQNDLINAVEQGNINSWLPGSGDWSSLIGLVGSGEDIVNTANLWGFRNYTNSYWAGLYEMMNATYTVLSQTGTVALDVSFHGYNHAITSADIPAPPPTIRNTIALCLTTFVMISIYKSFSKKIEKLKMVDTSVLKSEAHDDSDLM